MAKNDRQDLNVAAALQAAAEQGVTRRQRALDEKRAEEKRFQDEAVAREVQRVSVLKKKLEQEAEGFFARLFEEALERAANTNETSFRLIVAGCDRGARRPDQNVQNSPAYVPLTEANAERLEELRVITLIVADRFQEGGCSVDHLLYRWRCHNDEPYHDCESGQKTTGQNACHGGSSESTDMSPESGDRYLLHAKAQGYIAIRVSFTKSKTGS